MLYLPLWSDIASRSIEHMFDQIEPRPAGGAEEAGTSLLDALACFDRDRAAIARRLGAFEQSGLWAADGMLTLTAWLQHHARMSHRDALAWVRDGRFLHRYGSVADAAEAGTLSASQVAAMRAVVSKPTADLFDEHQHAVVDAVAGLDATATEVVCNEWRSKAEAVADLPEPKMPDRAWSMSKLADGTVVGRFEFDPATGAELDAALETARSFDGPGDDRNMRTRNADAVADILGFFNANHDRSGTPRHRAHVELHLEASTVSGRPPADLHALADDDAFGWTMLTSDRQVLPPWAKEKYECDCVLHRVMRAGSTVLDYGRATRTVSLSLFRAVAARDGGCRAPGCHRKVAWCDAHHIVWWRKFGETELHNLLLLCGRHHRLVHKERWGVELLANGDVRFSMPAGQVVTTEPRGRPPNRIAA